MGCVHCQRQRGRLPSGFPMGRKWQERGQTQLPLLVQWIWMCRQAAVEETRGVFRPFHSRLASSHPTSNQCAGARVGVHLRPLQCGQRARSPDYHGLGTDPGPGHMGLLGRGAGQRVSWDSLGIHGGVGDALEAEGLVPRTGQHPGAASAAAGRRPGGWAVLRQRARGKRDPDPLRMLWLTATSSARGSGSCC